MKIEVPDLTPQECGDIAITAAEGGTGYWARIESYKPERWCPSTNTVPDCIDVPDDFVFYRIAPLKNTEDDYDWLKAQDVTPVWIRKGFERAMAAPLDKGGWFAKELLNAPREDWTGEIDADGADLIFQFAFYGEVVWG